MSTPSCVHRAAGAFPRTEMTDMTAALFRPFDLAGTSLRNRIAMAPMTRARNPGAVANELTAQY
ncbi:hypothetical protein ABTE96_20575, partial [Acinetobacter baumannii]